MHSSNQGGAAETIFRAFISRRDLVKSCVVQWVGPACQCAACRNKKMRSKEPPPSGYSLIKGLHADGKGDEEGPNAPEAFGLSVSWLYPVVTDEHHRV